MPAAVKRYLFIGGPWDGRRELVAPDYGMPIAGEPLPRQVFEVSYDEPLPVVNGTDWYKAHQRSSVTINRVQYRREILQGNTGRRTIIYVHGDVDLIEQLVEHYRKV